jgi:hypothetical protein
MIAKIIILFQRLFTFSKLNYSYRKLLLLTSLTLVRIDLRDESSLRACELRLPEL